MKRILFILLVPAILLSACYSLAEDITPPPGYVYETPRPTQAPTEVMYFPLMPPNPQRGEAIFTEKCTPCHGEAGLGDGPEAIDLPNPVAPIGDPDLARQRTPEEWFRMVTNGNIDRYMPPFLSLTERERWDVVAYAFTLSVEPAAIGRGEEAYQENCAKCHGQSGQGDGVQARVAPEIVSPDSPLFTVDGTTSIVQFETDVLGRLSLIEEDPGPHTTAYGLLADFLNAVTA